MLGVVERNCCRELEQQSDSRRCHLSFFRGLRATSAASASSRKVPLHRWRAYPRRGRGRPVINSAGGIRGSRETGARSRPPPGRIRRRARCRRHVPATGAFLRPDRAVGPDGSRPVPEPREAPRASADRAWSSARDQPEFRAQTNGSRVGTVAGGPVQAAIQETSKPLRLSPVDSFAGIYTAIHGLALFGARRGESAKGPAGDLVSHSLCPHMLGRRKRAEVKRRVLLDAVATR